MKLRALGAPTDRRNVMKVGLLLCSLLAAAPAFAENLVAYEGGTAARLSEQPCSNEQVLGQLDPKLRPAFATSSSNSTRRCSI